MVERTLTTMHGRQDIDDLRTLHGHYPNYPLVSISKNQRRAMPHLNWVKTVHHGYPKSQYQFSPVAKGGYLAFLGRIAPEKGVDLAIEIARRAGVPLRIAAKVDRADTDYFQAHIKRLLKAPGAEFIGEIAESEKSTFLGGALALLFPISWPEPFGLVMIEAMACGTPVIGFRRGSVPEVVKHDVTGFIVQTVEEAIGAVNKISSIDRAQVRTTFERRFSVEVMAKNYEHAYADICAMRENVVPMPRRVSGSTALRTLRPHEEYRSESL
jgi:glycosyltransferase involved in cell wall biosynthesis